MNHGAFPWGESFTLLQHSSHHGELQIHALRPGPRPRLPNGRPLHEPRIPAVVWSSTVWSSTSPDPRSSGPLLTAP